MRCSLVDRGDDGGLGAGQRGAAAPWQAAVFRIGLLPFQAVAATSRPVEESVLTAILQDAWRQYRRRPLAVALTVGFGLVRAFLLKAVYAVPAFLIGILLLGPRDTGPLPASEQAKFFIGLAPLFAFAWAFLAVLPQRVVLDNERRVLRGATVAHRVAAAHFPICLVIALVDAISLMTAGLPTGLAGLAAIILVLSLLEPFRIAMGNALFLRTRALHVVEPKARSGDQNRW
jgi:hypothetical protein